MKKKKLVYYTVYRHMSARLSPLFNKIGVFTVYCDALQAIVTAYRRYPSGLFKFTIRSSTTKPKHWIHPSRYKA
jgi:hypothetical protein